MFELYHHGLSVCAAKFRLVLAEKDVAWEGHYLDILASVHHTPEQLKIYPKGVVPALIHGRQGLSVRSLTKKLRDQNSWEARQEMRRNWVLETSSDMSIFQPFEMPKMLWHQVIEIENWDYSLIKFRKLINRNSRQLEME